MYTDRRIKNYEKVAALNIVAKGEKLRFQLEHKIVPLGVCPKYNQVKSSLRDVPFTMKEYGMSFTNIKTGSLLSIDIILRVI